MRYDVKGRKYIGTETKYYFEDIGIRNAILNFRQQEELMKAVFKQITAPCHCRA